MKLFKKISLAVLIVIIITFGTLSYLLFSNSEYKLTAKPSVQVFDSIMDAKDHGRAIELREADINSVFSILIKDKVTKGDITIYGIEAKIKSSKITFFSPVSYKGFKMLISTSGILSDNGNNIVFKPSYIRAGRIKLPLKFLLSKVKDKNTGKFKVNDDTISLNKSLLPFTIDGLKIIDDHMQLSFKKSSLAQEEKPSDKSEGTKNSTNSSSNLSLGTNSSSKTKSNDKSKTPVNPPVNQEALKKLSSQLSSAISIVIGSKEKDILSRIKASVDKKIAEPNYNIYNDVSSVKSSYKALAPVEKEHIKSAILATVDIENALELNEIFGL